MKIEVIRADYMDEQHANDIPFLLDQYAKDPMGGGKALAQEVKEKLVAELSKRPHAFSILAYAEDQPAGLVNCFEGYSTFAGKALINIHDFVVLPNFRGYGLSQKMLHKVEEIARESGCCKITLEVLSNNEPAKAAYRKFGFTEYELVPEAGFAIFWQKCLTDCTH